MDEAQHRLALPQGTRIGDFEFHRVLGQGGFGITYLGWNHALDIPVAIKEYLPADLAIRESDLSVVPQSSQAVADFQWGLDRFVDEARILARFQHPNIVRVHHFFQAHNTAYIVMEYAEGETLSTYLNRKGILTESELKAILHPILDGLIVTPGYAPIEQYSTRGHQGPWTDIYALAGVCYRALTDDVPDDATDRVRRDPLIPVADRCKGRASHHFLAAIDHALQVDEDARPQTVSEWRAELGDTASISSPSGSSAASEWHTESAVDSALPQGHSKSERTIDESPNRFSSAPKADDAKRLQTWFSMHWICLVATIPLSLISVSLYPIAVIIATVFSCLVLHKLWSLIPADKARTTPGKAIGFLFIPLFNFYWNFVAIHGLAKALNAESSDQKISTFFSLSFCCLPWLAILLTVINSNDDPAIVGGIWVLTAIIMVVAWLIILWQMKNAGIRIAKKEQ